jgi:hypothetical protein
MKNSKLQALKRWFCKPFVSTREKYVKIAISTTTMAFHEWLTSNDCYIKDTITGEDVTERTQINSKEKGTLTKIINQRLSEQGIVITHGC